MHGKLSLRARIVGGDHSLVFVRLYFINDCPVKGWDYTYQLDPCHVVVLPGWHVA